MSKRCIKCENEAKMPHKGDELREYKNKVGNCNFPDPYAEQPSLESWCKNTSKMNYLPQFGTMLSTAGAEAYLIERVRVLLFGTAASIKIQRAFRTFLERKALSKVTSVHLLASHENNAATGKWSDGCHSFGSASPSS
jgi:hypothetical protein